MVLARRDEQSDAVVLASLVFPKQRKLLGIEETGMGIEHAQHARNGALIDGLIYVDVIGIVVLDNVQNLREVPHSRLVIIRRGGRGSHARGVNATPDCGYPQYSHYKYKYATL